MYLDDPIIWPHVPKYDSRTRIFLLEVLLNIMTENVFQRCSIVSTQQDCSGKKVPEK
jgi:hypothetical protein